MKLKLMSMEELSRLVRNEGENTTLRSLAQHELTSREKSLFGSHYSHYSQTKNKVSGHAFANLDYAKV